MHGKDNPWAPRGHGREGGETPGGEAGPGQSSSRTSWALRPYSKSPGLESGGRGFWFLPGERTPPGALFLGLPIFAPPPDGPCRRIAEHLKVLSSPCHPLSYTTKRPQAALPSWPGQGLVPPFQMAPLFPDVNLSPAKLSHTSPPSTWYPDTHRGHLSQRVALGACEKGSPSGPAPGCLLPQPAFPKV